MAYRSNDIPLSGDRLVDLLFKILLETLEEEIGTIRVKKDLRDNRKEALFGLLTEGDIYLGKRKHARKKYPIVSTLIHELWHEALEKTRERRILQLEHVLWTRFTDAQKRYLRKYIPKHEVKKDPEEKKQV